jgi:hypothetical protein
MERNEAQILLNKPIVVPIGMDPDNPIMVTVKAPCSDVEDEYLALIGESLRKFAKTNLPVILGTLQGKNVDDLPFDPAEIVNLFRKPLVRIIADGTGRDDIDMAWIGQNTNKAQQAALLRAFGDVIGWEYLKATFSLAITAVVKSMTSQSGSAAGPSWSRESSSTSPNNSPN